MLVNMIEASRSEVVVKGELLQSALSCKQIHRSLPQDISFASIIGLVYLGQSMT